MRRAMVQYKVKPDLAHENEQLVRAVFDELHANEPAGLRYATLRLEDGVTFVHLVTDEREDGVNPLIGVKAFNQFVAGVADRCQEPPVAREMQVIGSFRMFER